MAADALGAGGGPLLVAVAPQTRGHKVPAAQRELGLIVIEADQRRAVRALAVPALGARAAAVGIAVAGLAGRAEARSLARVVAGAAPDRAVPPLQGETGLLVVRERKRIAEAGGLVATGTVHAVLLAVDGLVAGQAGDGTC